MYHDQVISSLAVNLSIKRLTITTCQPKNFFAMMCTSMTRTLCLPGYAQQRGSWKLALELCIAVMHQTVLQEVQIFDTRHKPKDDSRSSNPFFGRFKCSTDGILD